MSTIELHKTDPLEENEQYEELKYEDDIDVYSPINLKGKSESVHSASGSFSGSGRKQRKHESMKSYNTLDKADSDFFNLTQESQMDLNAIIGLR
jgi:hypothetical protein